MKYDTEEVLFVEGDLDIDNFSLEEIVNSSKSVLTYSYEPIFSDKAVVLIRDDNGNYKYAYNSSHGLLRIDEPFSCILNSGQTWKFRNIDALNDANNAFYSVEKGETNLRIIQRYFDMEKDVELISLKRWTNCNTREDYQAIRERWETEEK